MPELWKNHVRNAEVRDVVLLGDFDGKADHPPELMPAFGNWHRECLQSKLPF